MSRPGWDLHWEQGCVKQLSRISGSDQDRVIRAMERYAETGVGDVRSLTGMDGTFRLRVGPWRLMFESDAFLQRLVVVSVKRRNEKTYER